MQDLEKGLEAGVTRVGRVCLEVAAYLEKTVVYGSTPSCLLDAESRGHEEPVEHIEDARIGVENPTDDDCEEIRMNSVASNLN